MDAQDRETPQGPADPHGQGGIDAPTPPGGPQRTDAPATGETPGENAPDPGPDDPSGGGQVPEPVRDPDAVASDEERAEQVENAETSLDQPSG